MKAGIIRFPGSNCDRDMFHVLSDVYGMDTRYIWHDDTSTGDVDLLVLPGGFSYGDHLRAGVIAASSPIIKSVRDAADSGMPILGVCNGFQILVEAHILPGALQRNTSLEFMCNWTSLIVKNNKTPFTTSLDIDQHIPIPIANGEGRYYVDDITLEELKTNNQIVFVYSEYINGSTNGIAGVCNKNKNVVGMMPHPERAAESAINPLDNIPASLIFKSMLNHIGVL